MRPLANMGSLWGNDMWLVSTCIFLFASMNMKYAKEPEQ